ncbi:MAG: GPI anchored serine-threonine rich family protein [Candidatus Lokiarchaeota archaeon]|nr:GPI anchored serine-threonine rich family protein [Candidatus Lokiarchaeota archaeon]
MKSIKKKNWILLSLLLTVSLFGLSVNLFSINNELEVENSNNLESSGTLVFSTVYGGFVGVGYSAGENEYITWNFNVTVGPPEMGLYVMNNSEANYFINLALGHRTPGNFTYTELLSLFEMSGSGIYYPPYYEDYWRIYYVHHGTTSMTIVEEIKLEDEHIQLSNPTGDSLWELNCTSEITWTSEGDFENVDIELYHNGSFVNNIITNALNNGSFLWTLPNSFSHYDDLYQVKVINTDNSSTYGISTAYFEIAEPRSISVNYPNSSSSWEAGTTQTISWDTTGLVTHILITILKNNSPVYQYNCLNTGSFNWTVPLTAEPGNDWKIILQDVNKSYISVYTEEFEIYIIDIYPIPGYNEIFIIISFLTLFGLVLLENKKKFK